MTQFSSYIKSLASRLRCLDESAGREFAGLCAALLLEIYSRGRDEPDLEDKIRKAVFKMVMPLAMGEVHDIEQFALALAAIAGRPTAVESSLEHAAQSVNKVLGPRERLIGGMKVRIGFWPFHTVGGDFYETGKLSNGRSLVTVGDAVGKGPTACAHSLYALTALRMKVSSTNSAAELIRYLNSIIAPIRGGDSVSVSMLEWSSETRTAQIFNAGMPRPIRLTSSNVVEEIDVCGHPLGWFPNPIIGMTTLNMEKTDRLLLWSDGIADSNALKNSILDSLANTGELPREIGFATAEEDVERDDRTAVLVEFI